MPVDRRLIATGEVPPGEARLVKGWRRELAVFHVEGRYYTLANSCPHVGAPLAKGKLCGHEIVCPWHAWRFDVRTGQGLTHALPVASYPTRVEDGWVIATLPD
ncbi:MAG: Rieske 2Fe-2S domain-containing protein [Pirellulales bacterium]|nr:Rieske 2Fe-2S domain-containing protein [Pirellulales bacterium]